MDDDVETDQRSEHHKNPPEFLDLETLFNRTGVEYFKVSGKSNISDNLKCSVNISSWKNSKRRHCDKKRKCILMHIFSRKFLCIYSSSFSTEVVEIPCADQYLKRALCEENAESDFFMCALIDDVMLRVMKF